MARLIKSSCFEAAAALTLALFWASVFGSDVNEGSTMIWHSSRPLAEVVRISGSQRFLSQGREEPDAFRPEGSGTAEVCKLESWDLPWPAAIAVTRRCKKPRATSSAPNLARDSVALSSASGAISVAVEERCGIAKVCSLWALTGR
jgi:hypothetical protein